MPTVNANPLAQFFPAAQGLTRAVPGSQLIPDDYTQQLPLEPASGVASMDPSVANAVIQDRLKSEFEDRLFNAQRTGDVGSVAALQTALGRMNQEQTSGPLAQQRQGLNTWNTAQQNAIAQGFRGGVPTPDQGVWSTASADPSAQMAGAQRAVEAAKAQIPLQQTQAAQAAETQRETMKETAAKVEKEAERAQQQKEYQDLQQFLTSNPALANRMTGITLPGTRGGVSFATPAQGLVIPKLPPGKAGEAIQQKIMQYQHLTNPTFWDRVTSSFDPVSIQQKAENLRRELDVEMPGWEKLQLQSSGAESSVGSTANAPVMGGVRMRAPSGQETTVPASQVDHYKALGAVVIG